MKKRVFAFLSALVLALGICSGTRVSAAENTFQVGFSRVDINPWVDVNDHSKGVLQLPLRGNGNTMNRQSVPELIDDNGDGVVMTDGSDGLFATCIAITDDDGDTVLMYSVAIIGGFTMMVDDTRAGVVAALAEKGIQLSEKNIQIQGTHTHNSIDLSQYKSSHKDSATEWYLQDQSGKKTEQVITGAQVYENFEVWYPYLIDQLVSAGVQAVEDRAAATMYKGEIDAGDAAGKVMNTVRHYTRVAKSTGEVYVRGSNFNSSGISYKSKGDSSATTVSGSAELMQANDTMYCLSFQFSDGREPIALVNWRAHTTQNDTSGTRLNVSSCYVNCMSRVLSDAGYRSIFIQGAAGNVNPSSAMYGSWCGSSKHTYTYSVDDTGKISCTGELRGNIYGEVLGQVAVKCLDSNMEKISAGDIRITDMTFKANAKSYDEDVMYYAGKTASAYYALESSSVPFVYPAAVYTTYVEAYTFLGQEYGGDYLYNLLSTDLQVKADEFTASGKSYTIASRFHASDVIANYKETGTEEVALTAFLLGDNVAFVTAPGEMYDRYNSQVTWEDLEGKTQKQVYDILSATNEWDKLLSSNVGGSYGTPFVMGYANRHVGYLPNKIAYEYCSGSTVAAVGAYEAHCTELAQGEGEAIMDIYAAMLGSLVGEDNDLYRRGWCDDCSETVTWEAFSSRYNGTYTMSGGHYFLADNVVASEQTFVPDGAYVCLDLNGHTVTGPSRTFNISTGGKLSVMDSAGGGAIQGYGSANGINNGWGGGAVIVNTDSVFNLYSGTVCRIDDGAHFVRNGGAVYVRGTMNMYGGTVEGTSVGCYGGAIYVDRGSRGTGTLNLYGGTVTMGSWYENTSYTDWENYGQCVYSKGYVNLGGDAQVAEVMLSSMSETYFGVVGSYTGSTVLRFPSELTAGQVVGHSDGADLDGADISVYNSQLQLLVNGSTLEVNQVAAAVYGTDGRVSRFSDIYDGILACQGTDKTLVLLQDSGLGYMLAQDLKLDLNGHSMTGAFSLSAGTVIQVSDSATDDYDVSDGVFGKMRGAAALQPAEGYVMYTHEDGTCSFHKVGTAIKNVSLRPSCAGMYYGAAFMADEYAAQLVESFGVALSITGDPVNGSGFASGSLYSEFGKELLSGDIRTSTVLTDILTAQADTEANRANGERTVWARSYIKLTDGSYIISPISGCSLRALMERIDVDYEQLSDAQQQGLVALYASYYQALFPWDLDNIMTAFEG